MSELTIEEVSGIANLSVEAIYETRRRGQPPGSLAFRRGKRLLWRQEVLDAWNRGEVPLDASAALVLEVRGVNRRLSRLITLAQEMLDELRRPEEEPNE